MTRSTTLLTMAVFAAASVAAPLAAAPEDERVAQVRQEIEAKELSIYSGRAKGQLDFYVDNASPHYLGWPPTAKAPFPLNGLRADRSAMAGKTQEKIETVFTGFTLSGATAVIYYTNHRTRTSDGKPVDQIFENIHVWSLEDGVWKVLAGLSRMTRG